MTGCVVVGDSVMRVTDVVSAANEEFDVGIGATIAREMTSEIESAETIEWERSARLATRLLW